jgi:CheY-specific phosphatase CheX
MPLPERDIYYFIEATLGYLNKMTENEISAREPTIEFQSLVFSGYTGLLHLKGGVEGFIYLTASQAFLNFLQNTRQGRGRPTEEGCRDAIQDIVTSVSHTLRNRFGPDLNISEPRVFTTVPDDPIEMPPAVFVQPLFWRNEYAYCVLGLTSSEMPT